MQGSSRTFRRGLTYSQERTVQLLGLNLLLSCALALWLVPTAAAQEPPLPDFSQMRLLDAEPSLPDKAHEAMGMPPESNSGDVALGAGRPPAASASNSSYPPPVCDGPYIQYASDTVCTSILPNENYLAVLTQRSNAHHTTGEQIQDWLDTVSGHFQLAWSSLPESPQPNASAPPTNLVVSTPNATNAPGDLHVFYRSTVGLHIERMIDGLVRQRVDDWHFTPLYRRQSKWAHGLEYHYEFHQFLLPRLRVSADRWPQSDYRQLIPAIQSALSPGSRLERHTRRLGSPERFQVFPAGRDVFKQLHLEQRLRSVSGVAGVSFYERSFYLPGDRCVPCGGPSGGPGGGAATAVPISSATSRGLLILGLVIAGLYWMRRQM